LLKIRLINPMTDTLLFMGLTFALGFIQIWFSQIVKIYHALKFKLKDQIWESGTWLAFLTSLPIAFLLKSIWPARGRQGRAKYNLTSQPLTGKNEVLVLFHRA